MLDAIGVCGGDCLIDWDGDGLCDSGCTDAAACNYDASNVVDDGSCTCPDPPYGCDGLCVNDSDGDGVCDELEIYGCTNPLAWSNETCGAGSYNPAATEDDGSCVFNILVRPLPAYRLQLSVQEMQMEMASATTLKMRGHRLYRA